MQKLIIIFVLILVSLNIYAQEIPKFPAFETVVNKFYNNYQNDQYLNILYFEKKLDGWHISFKEYDTDKEVFNELFWSFKERKFQDLSLKKNSKIDYAEIDALLNSRRSVLFKIHLYYGYLGWEDDVIALLENKKELSDTLLYSLGRAYSSKSGYFLHSNWEFANPDIKFDMSEGQNALSKEQLQKYKFYANLAIKQYEKLKKQNPYFETIVGLINTKYSNEYLTAFLNLRIYQNEKEAKKMLKKGLYDDFYISYAKNCLQTCEPNAILFTYGDNDTYPLLYVQAQYGFRKDVMVINVSLLQTSRYINHLRNPILLSDSINISLCRNDYKENKRDIIVLEDNKKFMNLKKMISYVKNDSNIQYVHLGNYFVVPSSKYSLEVNKTKYIKENIVSDRYKNNIKTNIQWDYVKPYMYRSQLIMFDIIANNNWKRPIYFGSMLGSEYYLSLDNYMQIEGLVYRLVPYTDSIKNKYIGFVNNDIFYDNVMNKYSYKNIDTVLFSRAKMKLYENYRNNFILLGTSYHKQGKDKLARIAYEKAIEIFPDNIINFDYDILPIIEFFYKISEYQSGNSLAIVLIDNIENKKIYTDMDLENQKNAYEYILNELKIYANEYNQQVILDRIDN